MARVFISYSRNDKDFVSKLGEALAAQQREAWVDWKDIPLTAEWQQVIFTNIEAADDFLFIISPESVSSPNCRKEIEHAAANNKRMIPIFHRPVPNEAIPEALNKFQRLDFSGGDNFNSKFETLIKALDTDLAWVQTHTRLLLRAMEWERERKDNSFVLRGKDLREAELWVTTSSGKEPSPTTLQSQYIVASRQAATRVQRIVICAVAVAFLTTLGLTIYAFRKRNVAQFETKEAQTQRELADANALKARKNAEEATQQRNTAIRNETEAKRQEGIAKKETAAAEENARESDARELAAYAVESLNEDPERSIILSMYAVNATFRYGAAPVRSAVEALHKALLSSQLRRSLGRHVPVDHVTVHPTYVAWGRDGRQLVTGSDDGVARIWDLASGREVLTIGGNNGPIYSLALSPDGGRLATGTNDGTVQISDTIGATKLQILPGPEGIIESVAWSPLGNRLASGQDDGTVQIWDSASWKNLLTLRGPRTRIESIAWSPNGGLLAVGGYDEAISIWDATNGSKVTTLPGSLDSNCVAWSPDGTRLATASERDMVTIWDSQTYQQLLYLRGHSGSVESVAWSRDGKLVATGSWDDTARIWDAGTGQELQVLRGNNGTVWTVVWSPDSRWLATGEDYNTAKVWHVGDGPEEMVKVRGDFGSATPWSPNGRRLVTTTHDGKTTTIWEASTGMLITKLQSANESFSHPAWSPDGTRLATTNFDGSSKVQLITVWDSASGKEKLTIRLDKHDLVDSVAWGPDGGRLVTSSLGSKPVRIWSATTGQELAKLPISADPSPGRIVPDAAYDVAWSPDGKRIAIARHDHTATIWGTETGRVLTLGNLQGTGVSWSPDGKRLAAGSALGATVWDAHSGKEILTLSDEGGAAGVAWSPDGTRLATGGKALKVWDLASRKEVLSLPKNAGRIAWSPDGKRLVSQEEDGVQVYAIDIRDLLELAHNRITRNLTPDECVRYFQSKTCPPLP